MDNEYIFKAKTVEAYTIKTLTEVLQNILTDVCFEFTKSGIKLLTVDNKKPSHLLVNLTLNADQFEEYYCKSTLTVGINLQHYYKMLKSIKKKDQLMLFVTPDKSTHLGICTKQTESGQATYSWIKIQRLQKVDTDIPRNYNHPNLIHASNFQKMCKDMNSMSKIIKIYSKGTYISFSCEVEGMYTREVPFGELKDNDEEEYEDTFNTKTLSQLIKASGLNNKMQIYTRTDSPLKIVIRPGSLGVLEIYLKSRAQLDQN